MCFGNLLQIALAIHHFFDQSSALLCSFIILVGVLQGDNKIRKR